MVNDYEVLLLHYTADKMVEEIKNIDKLKIVSKRPIVKSFPLLSELFHFKKVYNDFNPDIIHSGYAWQVGILPSMLNIHPHLSMPWGSDILVEPDKYFFIKPFVKKVVNQCDHIHCDAQFVKKKVMEDYHVPAEKITVFPRGIELEKFLPGDKSVCRKELGLDENKFILIFNRHLNPIYGINDLLEGFKIFSNGKNDVLMIMVSDGILKKETDRFIIDNNLNAKIKIIGKIPNSQISAYLNASDVYISTSLSDGTSLSLLEAMAMGLGIIVTAVPSIKEWINGENGFVVPIGGRQKIADAIESYYQNRSLISIHGQKNIRIANDRADWNKNYLKLREVYSRLLHTYSKKL
jgi:glycosyltransferase involved in cell wall biosynthesis